MSVPAGPFTMPEAEFVEASISLPIYGQSVNRLRGGAVRTRTIGHGYRTARMRTRPLNRVQRGAWRAFLANLRGAENVALLWNPHECYPAAYTSFAGMVRYGGSAFDGTCGVASIVSVREVSLAVLPVGFVFSPGDRIGFIESGRYFLADVTQGATASASGVVTITIEPELPSIFTDAATVNFYRPKGEFMLDAVPEFDSSGRLRAVSFSAVSRGY